MSALHDLATAAGLQIDWRDAMGKEQRVSDEALARILGLLGHPAETDRAIAQSREQLAAEGQGDCDFVSGDVGRETPLPRGCASAGKAEVLLEDGETRAVELVETADGLRLPAIDVAGYHRLVIGNREIRLAIAPDRCFRVQDAAPGKRIWGAAVQIPALRDHDPTAYGDFGVLGETAQRLAVRGADAVAISPVHALFPADATRFSPYAPSSRLFLNVLFGDPALIGEPLPPQPDPALIDWETAIPERLRLLRGIFARLPDGVRTQVEAYRRQRGKDLERHATFDALHAHFFASGARGWRDWPDDFHDPAGVAVTAFAGSHAEDVNFYLFLQWLANGSLAAAQKAASGGGMAVGLIADLAVGMDPGGSHAWARPDDVLTGLSLGAPPDLLGPDGQSWGITGFSPQALRRTGFDGFVQTLRASLGNAGGIRIDHALGLRRLWVVPDGVSPAEGAYLTMPMDDLLRLIALESQREQAIVIGEDLGTVPEGLRPAMEQKAMLGMQVLWFEQEKDGSYTPPENWRGDAAGMTGTHDLPTVAGWWQGRDIDWTWKLGRTSRAESEKEDQAKRAEERGTLWRAFEAAGVTQDAEPGPGETKSVVDAALAYVGNTPCVLAILPMEDVVGLDEQPNLPGTMDEHPNWRRRMPDSTDRLLDRAEVVSRVDLLNAARGA